MNQEQAQRKRAPNHAETDARHQHVEELGDFTTTLRVLPISGLAIVIGAVCAVLALVLLRLRQSVAGQRNDRGDPWSFAGEMVYLGGVPGIGNVRRRAGAAVDDGRSTGRPGSDVPAE